MVPHIGHYKDAQSKLIKGILAFSDKLLGKAIVFVHGFVM
jgi:hypothetical protein